MTVKKLSKTKKETKQRIIEDKKYTIEEVLLTYSSWAAMRKRCNGNSSNPIDIKFYIEPGIKVSKLWENSFEQFIMDLGPRPGKDYSLDRFPNKYGNYEAGNVRWANAKDQACNRKSTKLLTFDNQTNPTSVWAKITGISRCTIQRRIDKGWNIKDTLTIPVKSNMIRK